MEETRDQTTMGVGHLEPDTSSDDFAEEVGRKRAGGEDADIVSHALGPC